MNMGAGESSAGLTQQTAAPSSPSPTRPLVPNAPSPSPAYMGAQAGQGSVTTAPGFTAAAPRATPVGTGIAPKVSAPVAGPPMSATNSTSGNAAAALPPAATLYP